MGVPVPRPREAFHLRRDSSFWSVPGGLVGWIGLGWLGWGAGGSGWADMGSLSEEREKEPAQ